VLKRFGFVVALLLGISCQSTSKHQLSSRQIKILNQAVLYVQEGQFLEAAHLYDKLSKELKNKPIEAMMLFSSGSNYRSLGDCNTSVARYRRMLEKSLNQPYLKARGLIEISYSYECIGDIESSLLSLKDAENLKRHLPLEVRQILHPSRLSLAYASLGQAKKANQYKMQVLINILKFKNQYKSSKDMSRMFFLMGKSYRAKFVSDPSFLKSFPYHQIYLLQSVFLKDDKWSLKSKRELEFLFDNLRKILLSIPQKERPIKQIKIFLKEGQKMVQAENSLEIESFYKKQQSKLHSLLNVTR